MVRSLTKKEKYGILITLMLSSCVASAAVTVPIIMLPRIIEQFSVNVATAQWLTSGASLISGVIIPLAAYLIKRFPSRIYYLLSIAVFSLGSVITVFAQNFEFLLLGRLVQALGSGLMAPFAQVVLMSIFEKERYGSVMGLYSLGSMVAPVAAPMLAGLIMDSFGWQMVFAIVAILGVISFFAGLLFMRSVTGTMKADFNLPHMVLFSLGISGILIGCGNFTSEPFLSVKVLGALTVGVAALASYVSLDLKREKVLLNLRIFGVRRFRIAVGVIVLGYLICMGSGTVLPIFAQNILGHNATSYAFYTLPGTVLMAVLPLVSGRIYDKIGAKALLLAGSLFLSLGGLVGALVFRGPSGLLAVGVVCALIQIGFGLISTPATTMALADLQGSSRVDGSSVLSVVRQISNSFSIVIAVTAYTLFSNVCGDLVSGMKLTYASFFAVGAIGFVLLFRLLGKNG